MSNTVGYVQLVSEMHATKMYHVQMYIYIGRSKLHLTLHEVYMCTSILDSKIRK